MCGHGNYQVMFPGLFEIVEKQVQKEKLAEQLTMALLETSKYRSAQERANEIHRRIENLDPIRLAKALARTQHLSSMQDRAVRIIEIINEKEKPIPFIPIVSPMGPNRP